MTYKYKWKQRPYRHQVAAVKKLLANQYGGALLMEPRTGKTKTLIDWASILHLVKGVTKVLVVPPNGVMGVWEQEIKKNCPYPHLTIVWDREARSYIQLPKKINKLCFLILNYDAFAHPANRKRIIQQIKRWGPEVMILDESHIIKTPSARKTTAIISIAHTFHRDGDEDEGVPPTWTTLVPYRAIATGTVITKKKRVYDVWAQWKFLNPNRFYARYRTFANFKSEFSLEKDMGSYKKWLRNKNEPLLHKLVHRDAFAIKRSECFDLPPRDDQVIPVKLTPRTMKIYDELAEEMVAEIIAAQEDLVKARKRVKKLRRLIASSSDSRRTERLEAKLEAAELDARANWRVTASIPLVASLRMCQLTSGIVTVEDDDENKKLMRVGNEKLKVCQELLTDLFEAEEKVVVAARFKADIASIKAWAVKKKIKTWTIQGGVSRRDRDIYIEAFRKHQGAGLMIVQPRAASLGIDLSTASTMIWYSLTPSFVDFSQTCDRIALSDKPTSIMYLIAEGTYDEVLYETLRGDGEVVQLINRSPDVLRRNFKVANLAA